MSHSFRTLGAPCTPLGRPRATVRPPATCQAIAGRIVRTLARKEAA